MSEPALDQVKKLVRGGKNLVLAVTCQLLGAEFPTFANSCTKDRTGETFRCCKCGTVFSLKAGGNHKVRRA